MKFFTLIFILFFVGKLNAQRTYELKTTPIDGQVYLKITNGQFIFWITQKDFCDIFSVNDRDQIKLVVESFSDVISIEYLTTEISKITQDSEDIDKEIRYLILNEDLFIERVSDGLFLSEYTVLTNEKIRSLVDDQGQSIVKEWEISKFKTIGTPSF